MTTSDIRFTPHSDMNISDLSIVNQHQNLIKNNQLSDATALLNEERYNKGFRASLFNNMQNKLRMVQEHILSKEDTESVSDEVVSNTEPVNSEKQFWLQDY